MGILLKSGYIMTFKGLLNINILVILSSVLLNSIAQLSMRKGMLVIGKINVSNLSFSFIPMITNLYLWLAMLCYGISIFLWMVVLSKVEVSYALPFHSLSFVIITVAGRFLFNENVSLSRITGILFICLGVYIISRS